LTRFLDANRYPLRAKALWRWIVTRRLDRITISLLCLSMIFSENRRPLFRIMLSAARPASVTERLPRRCGRAI